MIGDRERSRFGTKGEMVHPRGNSESRSLSKGLMGGDRKACHTSRRPYFTSKPNLPFHIPNCKLALLGFRTHMSEILEWEIR